MRRLHAEALLYCFFWTALALAGFHFLGLKAGLALSIGLFLIVMPASAFILARTGNFGLERGVRWTILAVAALALFSLADLGG